jgi:hypothetical protein
LVTRCWTAQGLPEPPNCAVEKEIIIVNYSDRCFREGLLPSCVPTY